MGNAKNWTVNSYTNDEWTTLVDAQADLSCVIVSNTSGGSLNASIRLASDAGVERAVMMPTKAVGTNESYTFEIPGFKTGRNDVIQVKGSGAGLHFIASGEARG